MKPMHFEPTPNYDPYCETEPRFLLETDVVIRRPDANFIAGCLVNFSRSGFCVRLDRDLVPGDEIWLDVTGWPPLRAHVAWSHDDKAGGRLDVPLSQDRYEAMILSADAVDRAGEWDI